jgi:hypothetical protein
VGIAYYIWQHKGNQNKDPTEYARQIKESVYHKNRGIDPHRYGSERVGTIDPV